jgi:hypothetical protein
VSAETNTPSGAVSAEQAAATGAPTGAPTEPTPTVGGGQQSASHPAGSALPEGGVPVTEKPEVLVGAAFAGGFVAALLLKKIVG